MTVTLHKPVSSRIRLEFKSPELRSQLKNLCDKTLERFRDFPAGKLLCYFDDDNPKWLQQQFGEFAGIHVPIIGGGVWPRYVEAYFFDYSSGKFAFDNLIYIPETKYTQDKVSFVIIFAHELQHFVQSGYSQKVVLANILLFQNLARWNPNTELKPWGLPQNREAMIVAKQVAEAVCGPELVRRFIDAQIVDGKNANNVSKVQMWQWAATISPSTSYDLCKETDVLVRQYRQQLIKLKSKVDFSKPKWWL